MENMKDQVTSSEKKEEEEERRPRGRFAIKFCAAALAITLVGGGGFWAYTSEKFPWFNGFIDKYLHFNTDKDSVTEVINVEDTLPLDQNGIISITYPGVNRNIDEPAGFYSLPSGYTAFYVNENKQLNSAKLTVITDSSKKGENVVNYQSADGTVLTNFIGVQTDYADFLNKVKGIKEKIKNNDKTYTTALAPIKYEVPDLYLLNSGYELYCEDQSVKGMAKIAYVLSDGSTIYSIPSNVINKFIGVSTETCDLLVKYDALQAQIIDMYNVYSNGVGVNLDDEQENLGR